MKLFLGLSKVLIVTVMAAFFILGYASLSMAQPLNLPETSTPGTVSVPEEEMAATVTSPSVTITPIPTQSFSNKVNPSSSYTPVAIPSFTPTVPNPVQIGFLSVGRGDAILIIAPDGKTMLIDGGPHDSGITGILKKLGIKKIDVMVATHPHQDHVGGLSDVLKVFPVKQLYTNGESLDGDAIYEKFKMAVRTAGLKARKVKVGDSIPLGGLTLQVLNPRAKPRPDTNENSMVISFSYQGMTVLLMSDADHITESDLLKAELPVKADILKLGHHGSAQSSSKSFIEAVAPQIAIYSSGSASKYGLPEKAALNRVRKFGIKIFGTDKNGTIFVTSDPSGFIIETSKSMKK